MASATRVVAQLRYSTVRKAATFREVVGPIGGRTLPLYRSRSTSMRTAYALAKPGQAPEAKGAGSQFPLGSLPAGTARRRPGRFRTPAVSSGSSHDAHVSPSATYRLLSARCQLYADARPSGVTRNDTSVMMPAGSRGRMFFHAS